MNYQQDNWSLLLSLAEFVHNNAATKPLGIRPFFANYGFNPKFLTDVSSGAKKLPPNAKVLKFAETLKTLHQSLIAEMDYAQAAQA